jgi:hypothetical protein
MGAALGSIIAIIITAHIENVSHSWTGDHGDPIAIPGIADMPAMPGIPAIPLIDASPAGIRQRYSHASADSAARPPQIASRSASLSAGAVARLSETDIAEAMAADSSIRRLRRDAYPLDQLIAE